MRETLQPYIAESDSAALSFSGKGGGLNPFFDETALSGAGFCHLLCM